MSQETKKSARSLLHTIISLGILIGFIGIPIPSQAAALDGRRSIQKKFLLRSQFNQDDQKTFWLSTGQGATSGYALIALNNPITNDEPTLDPETLEANFHYVSNYFNPTTTNYWKLPAGLYFWKSGELKVRPDQKITYGSNKQKRCFAKIAGSKVSDECFNAKENYYALAQGSEVRTATIAYTQNPDSIPLHPFDDNTWAATITGQSQRPVAAAKPTYAAAQPAHPAAAVALPQGLTTISIASSNVMSQGQYEHDFPAPVKLSHMLPLNPTRTDLFHAAFQDPNQLAGKDFVMLQEFGLGMRDKDVGLENLQPGESVRSLKFALAQVPEYTSVAKEKKVPGIVDLLFNTQKYELVDLIYHGGPQGRYLGGVFTFKKDRKVKIGVVSAHIQYDDPDSKKTKKGKQQIKQLITDINTANTTHPDIAGWIVAGDYNINYNTRALDLKGMTDAGFQDVFVGKGTNPAVKHFTALGKTQPVGARGPKNRFDVSPEGIDYIWYRGNLQPTANSIYPAVADQDKRLLTGGNMLPNGTNGNDSGRDFFSDHAIVSATFALGGGGAQMQPQASQAFGGGLARQRPTVQQQPAFGRHAAAAAAENACPACTFDNPMGSRQCEICRTPLEAAPRAQMPQQAGGGLARQRPSAAQEEAGPQIMRFNEWKLKLPLDPSIDPSILRTLSENSLRLMYDKYVKSQHAQGVAAAGSRRAQMQPEPVQQQPAFGRHAAAAAAENACPACTFDNPMGSRQCEMCSTPLEAAPRAQMRQQPSQASGGGLARQSPSAAEEEEEEEDYDYRNDPSSMAYHLP